MRGFYVYASSISSIEKYPNNRGSNFTIDLPPKTDLGSSGWEVGLVEVGLPRVAAAEGFFLTCDACAVSCVGDRKLRVLRRLPKGATYTEFNNVQYISIQGDTSTMNITILEAATLLEATVGKKPVTLTLHFRSSS